MRRLCFSCDAARRLYGGGLREHASGSAIGWCAAGSPRRHRLWYFRSTARPGRCRRKSPRQRFAPRWRAGRLHRIDRGRVDHDQRRVEGGGLRGAGGRRIACAGAGIAVLGAQIAGGSSEGRVDVEPVTQPQSQAQAQSESGPRRSPNGKHTITGKVLAPDGNPLPGEEVFWLGYPRSQPAVNAMPKGLKYKPEDFAEDAFGGLDGRAGRFELDAEFDDQAFRGQRGRRQGQGRGRLQQVGLRSNHGKGRRRPGTIQDPAPQVSDDRRAGCCRRPARLRRVSRFRSSLSKTERTSSRAKGSSPIASAMTTHSARNTGRSHGRPTTMAASGSRGWFRKRCLPG